MTYPPVFWSTWPNVSLHSCLSPSWATRSPSLASPPSLILLTPFAIILSHPLSRISSAFSVSSFLPPPLPFSSRSLMPWLVILGFSPGHHPCRRLFSKSRRLWPLPLSFYILTPLLPSLSPTVILASNSRFMECGNVFPFPPLNSLLLSNVIPHLTVSSRLFTPPSVSLFLSLAANSSSWLSFPNSISPFTTLLGCPMLLPMLSLGHRPCRPHLWLPFCSPSTLPFLPFTLLSSKCCVLRYKLSWLLLLFASSPT